MVEKVLLRAYYYNLTNLWQGATGGCSSKDRPTNLLRVVPCVTCFLAIFSLASFLGVSAQARADLIDVVSETHQFGTLDLSTGAFSSIGTTPQSIDGMTNTNGGTIYAVDSSSVLRTIDPHTGLTTAVNGTNPGTSIIEVAQRPSDGALFGMAFSNGNLFTIDKTTALAAQVGSSTHSVTWLNIAFDGSGNLFLADAPGGRNTNSNLYGINTTTGAATLLGAIGTGANLFNVDALLWHNGALYGFTDGTHKIITINTTTGAGTDTGVNWNSSALTNVFATAEASVPEPSSVILSCLTASLLGIVGWRRRMATKARS